MNWSPGDTILEVKEGNTLTTKMFEGIDLFIYSRECPFNLDSILELQKEMEFKIIVDIDDSWFLPADHIIYDTWHKNGTSEQIIKSIRFADFVTTTHEYLRDKIVLLNPNVEILPNALPFSFEQFTEDKAQVEHKNIIYAAGVTHLNDLRLLGRFFELCRNDQTIQTYEMVLAGYNGTDPMFGSTWQKMKAVVMTYGRAKTWMPMPIDSYMSHYRYGSIAIAPLENTEFNRCKSSLKALEAGCKNLPLLASAIHPYTEMPVIHCKTQRDWYDNLKKLIKDPEFRIAQGKLLGDYVRVDYNLLRVNIKRKAIYEQVAALRLPSKDK